MLWISEVNELSPAVTILSLSQKMLHPLQYIHDLEKQQAAGEPHQLAQQHQRRQLGCSCLPVTASYKQVPIC